VQIPLEKVRIICKFVGGGFGGKLATEADAVVSALAARKLGVPVKTAFTRQQVVVNASHRTTTIQPGTTGRRPRRAAYGDCS
jgi:xanthine dehydrogenase YagR molybdenum-binding subunit